MLRFSHISHPDAFLREMAAHFGRGKGASYAVHSHFYWLHLLECVTVFAIKKPTNSSKPVVQRVQTVKCILPQAVDKILQLLLFTSIGLFILQYRRDFAG